MPRRRSYDQYCAAARALDAVGDRWTLLIVRELLAGPRRYTDLHADLPGVSTDMLASRLKDMERDDLVTRRRLPPPASAYVYEPTDRARDLLPVLRALAAWGAPALGTPGPTDAVRAHWFALPLLDALEAAAAGPGIVEVRLEEGTFHLRVGGAGGGAAYADGPATQEPDVVLRMDAEACAAVARGDLPLGEGVRAGRIEVVAGRIEAVLGAAPGAGGTVGADPVRA
ncbi:transcriptional regulator [Streptomyces sp. WAC05374]|uniref:winged helix-turn-helix transcriptional regulator n=1 Tax=Streptomyces sp. WAC05374 TaxID=2487420 RepID=UPI000F86166E|nr:helix-turn-helix domain-containing protein [Streptomyces sp. WAC05374]RST10196.1 transcriptional regulator [Streptomyces sp. WAC05374]TDF48391.1 transcriptional regulator [Streptomyces sp. WAC05374]TDF55053.1 transcriptional regulator [Streptomyces sp. WAC05374]TDF55325.1 transcriptional regulator [Streptomyces sp. WAC05374]